MPSRDVLIVTPSGRNLGGSEVMLGQFLASAERHGITARVVFLEGGDHYDEIRAAGYSCELLGAGRLRQPVNWLKVNATLAGILRRHLPSVLIGWQAKAAAYSALPAALAGVPFFCFHRGLPGRGTVDRISFLLPCQGYLANSHFTAEKLRVHTRRPIAVVHSCVDLQRFDAARRTPAPEMRERLGFDPRRPLVGIVGRLQHWKGMHVFLEAMETIVREYPGCQGVVVGGSYGLEPDYPAFLDEQLAARNLRETVRMAGAQRNVPDWMQAMDVVVHASAQEPFGLVVVEAMSLGKPVIATVPGGPREVVTHETSGLLVPEGDARALADAIGRLLSDAALAKRLGQEAAQTALHHDGFRYAPRVLDAIAGIHSVRAQRR
ncbi:MAG TPA: glycosyltransferase family 4 protein [Terrimicrobiaceae bacterium]|nr:glycosyltransferase family 4 protein [Terrimicrobiaceae bacterium]